MDKSKNKITKIEEKKQKMMDSRTARTLYCCLADNDSELSFEPNQIITNGLSVLKFYYCCWLN